MARSFADTYEKRKIYICCPDDVHNFNPARLNNKAIDLILQAAADNGISAEMVAEIATNFKDAKNTPEFEFLKLFDAMTIIATGTPAITYSDGRKVIDYPELPLKVMEQGWSTINNAKSSLDETVKSAAKRLEIAFELIISAALTAEHRGGTAQSSENAR